MALLLLASIYLLLSLAGATIRVRRQPRETFEQAALAITPASWGLAGALTNSVSAVWFILTLSLDELVKNLFRQYTLPGTNVDALLAAIAIGATVLLWMMVGTYRRAVWGEPPRRRRF